MQHHFTKVPMDILNYEELLQYLSSIFVTRCTSLVALAGGCLVLQLQIHLSESKVLTIWVVVVSFSIELILKHVL